MSEDVFRRRSAAPMTPTPSPATDAREALAQLDHHFQVSPCGCAPSPLDTLRAALDELDALREDAARRDATSKYLGGLEVVVNTALPIGKVFAHPDTIRIPDIGRTVEAFKNALADAGRKAEGGTT